MAAPLTEYLRTRPGGVTPLEFARGFLRLTGPPEVLERLARAALAAAPGVCLGPDGLARAVDALPPPEAVVLCGTVTGPRPPMDRLLAAGAASIRAGRVDAVLSLSVLPDPARSADRPDPNSGGEPVAAGEALARLGAMAAGADLVVFDDATAATWLRRALAAAGRTEGPRSVVRLAPALRRAGLLPPRGGPADAAARLCLPAPEGEEPGDHARALAGIFLAARERGALHAAAAPPPTFDFDRAGFGPDLLDRLPEAPGVYRFLDRGGALLYVGKAADLRRRVRAYFAPATRRRRREADLMARLYRIEWTTTGSELEALLAEAALIREAAPPYNVQRDARRRRPAAGDLALFLPAEDASRATVLFVREGAPAGRVSLCRAGPDRRILRAALRAAFFSPAPPPPAPEGDAQILASWLRSAGDRQNLMDVSECRGLADAERRVRTWLADPDLLAAKTIRQFR